MLGRALAMLGRRIRAHGIRNPAPAQAAGLLGRPGPIRLPSPESFFFFSVNSRIFRSVGLIRFKIDLVIFSQEPFYA